MTNEIVEAENHVQSTPATALKEQKHPEPKANTEPFRITSVSLFQGKQQSMGNDYVTNTHGALHQLDPVHASPAQDQVKHKRVDEHKKVSDHPVTLEEILANHPENIAAPTHPLNCI
ncbi:hypothetical protein BGZ70_001784 [Mortierella alpina]|uniref:Uncharacterized protein n=1 Tax=Mortierella alpina TaxID=64518 RepID=A0A9P6M5N2_MORAP|nr:hypothetical protein BGZ70_001784 [Mortierella alpina]